MPESKYGRIASLDGLRGIAALVVVFHHVLLTSASLALSYSSGGDYAKGSATWMLAYSPLHIVWAGGEAVMVFFILSGFVLAKFADDPQHAWRSYYPSRLVRLYIPVWGSLFFALALTFVIRRTDVAGGSWWLNAHNPADHIGFLKDLLLASNPDFVNSPLWSLKWEVAFSLLLPAYVVVGRWASTRRLRAVTILLALLFVMSVAPILHSNALRQMPIFGLGVLMYFCHADVAALGARISRAAHSFTLWLIIATGALALLTGYWVLQGTELPGLVVDTSHALQVIGALAVVFLAYHWQTAARLLERRSIQWLGKRSFSLYLVHEPIVVTIAFALRAAENTFLVGAIAIPLALVVTELFFRAVELPAHRASKAVLRSPRLRSRAERAPVSREN